MVMKLGGGVFQDILKQIQKKKQPQEVLEYWIKEGKGSNSEQGNSSAIILVIAAHFYLSQQA